MSKVSENFLPLYYDSIGPVPISVLSEDGSIDRKNGYPYPHRNLQDVTSQGVDPLILSGELVFLNGIEEYLNLWPDLFLRFRARLKRPELAHLQHPLYGEVWGYFSQFRVQYNVRELNGCRVNYVFEEVAEDDKTRPDLIQDEIQKALGYAQFVDAAVEQLANPAMATIRRDVTQPSTQITAAYHGTPVATTFTGFASYIQEADLIATAIQQQADQVKAQASFILAAPELQLPANYQVRDALVQYQSAVQASSDAAKATAGTIQYLAPLPFPLSPLEISLRLYGDQSRATEIYQLNPISMFEYPKGYVLAVPSLDFIYPSSIQKGQTGIKLTSSLQIPGTGLSISLPLGRF